ncbi:hypothetical protein MA04_03272 [Alcanivorax balearicus MACL04]|uniref:PilZ domain-containing protein n=1 Tax=Alloalcanivorax balearicus MACL04 TaxID=1177182 RepID=A0ABT2R2P3_9GAMM|nr:PilZ domain-containing protein [Alloalcanivorax balearicus]MCU5783972.1 hypothetical protein [Alloalcanivorax balearicus MACL04]
MKHVKEQRRHSRHRAPNGLNMRLRQDPPTEDDDLTLTCRDISRAGLGVELPYSIRPDTDVELWLQLPNQGGALHLFGTIAWCAEGTQRWSAGIALDLERTDGALWAARFDDPDV